MRLEDINHLASSGCPVCREIADIARRESEVKITYRGWIGHYILADRCAFRLNTLIEQGDVRVVVSTVGHLLPQSHFLGKGGTVETTGCESYYETRVGRAKLVEKRYWDLDVTELIPVKGKCTVGKMTITSDAEAQAMHEAIVQKIATRVTEASA